MNFKTTLVISLSLSSLYHLSSSKMIALTEVQLFFLFIHTLSILLSFQVKLMHISRATFILFLSIFLHVWYMLLCITGSRKQDNLRVTHFLTASEGRNNSKCIRFRTLSATKTFTFFFFFMLMIISFSFHSLTYPTTLLSLPFLFTHSLLFFHPHHSRERGGERKERIALTKVQLSFLSHSLIIHPVII